MTGFTTNWSLKKLRTFPLFIFFAALLFSCNKKGDRLENENPDTFIIYETINLTGEDRLNSVVKLSWYGTDVDGFVASYEVSTNNIDWTPTSRQDSVFRFSLPSGSDTFDLDFYVRAIDNLGAKDESPAYLKIPLRNTPPQVELVANTLPTDSVMLVTTFQYSARDLDGNESITKIEIKLNNGNWVEVDRSSSIVTIVPTNPRANGTTTARLIVNSRESAVAATDLKLNDLNTFYIRATDNAGSVSIPDTSTTFFIRNQTADILLISGHNLTIAENYKNALNAVGASFDFLDYGSNGGANQPAFWNPTFGLLINNYNILIINSAGTQYTNVVTGQSGGILEFGAQFIQSFINISGKKYLISTRFTPNTDLNPLLGVLPVSSLVTSPGQVRIVPPGDSLLPQQAGYPVLTPRVTILGPNPFETTLDAEPLYRAELTRLNGWSGTDLVAARRKVRVNGIDRVNQIFFSVQIHDFNNDITNFNAFFNQVINNDFNW